MDRTVPATLKGEAIQGSGEGVILRTLSTTNSASDCNNLSKHALSTSPHVFEGQYCWETIWFLLLWKI